MPSVARPPRRENVAPYRPPTATPAAAKSRSKMRTDKAPAPSAAESWPPSADAERWELGPEPAAEAPAAVVAPPVPAQICAAEAPQLRPAEAGKCRCTMTIGDKHYAFRRITREPGDEARLIFTLTRADGEKYNVVELRDGSHTCDCADHAFRREDLDPKGCKHIRALVACGFLAPWNPPRRPAPSSPRRPFGQGLVEEGGAH